MNSEQPFKLQPVATKPRAAPVPKPEQPKLRQTVLFSGLDCCPGQLDLFPTDGRPSESEKK